MTTIDPAGIADLGPLERAKEQKAWYWYDWANSAFYTTVLTVLFGPYMIEVAGKAAGCTEFERENDCAKTVSIGFLDLAAGSLPFYLTSFATIFSAFLLPVVGAMVDRSPRKKVHMAGFAWAGAFFCGLLFFMKGENWQLGAVCIVAASVLAGCSIISYSAILCEISTEEERDHVSSRGWAFGYLGGGLLLVVNLGARPRQRRDRAEHRHGRAHLPALRRACGGRCSRSSRSCGSRTVRPSMSWPGPGGCSSAPSVSCSPRSRTCASTR